MLAARIFCPSCGQALIVAENAPPRVTCPRCLSVVTNPASPHAGAPRPVLPLDTQAERDMRGANWVLVGLLVILGLATLATYRAGDLTGFRFVLMTLLTLIVFRFVAGGLGPKAPSLPADDAAQQAPTPVEHPESPGQPVVLHYGSPRRPDRTPATIGAFAAGFFSALGVCAVGFFILGATAGSRGNGPHQSAVVLAGVLIMVVAFIVLSVRVAGGWRGFGPGATTGLVLGLMALGPCAACYLMTLGG